jgi:hypothetical protein
VTNPTAISIDPDEVRRHAERIKSLVDSMTWAVEAAGYLGDADDGFGAIPASQHYAVPPPNTVGPQGFLLKYGTALDPVTAYRPAPGSTGITVHTSYYRRWIGAPGYAATGPRILVNGHEVPDTAWGSTHIPLRPGLYHLETCTRKTPWWFEWLMRGWNADMGFADTVVPVTADQSAPCITAVRRCMRCAGRSARSCG